MSSVIRLLLERAVRLLAAPRVIYDRDGDAPYLSRYYLTGRPTMPDGSDPFDASGAPRPGIKWKDLPFAIYLHKFHASDEAGELHNHPWKWAVSLVLAGGYSEERRYGQSVVRREVPPGSINALVENSFHRVDLLEKDAWTLFIVGPKAQSWGFWDRLTGIVTPWREYVAMRRGVDPASFGDSKPKDPWPPITQEERTEYAREWWGANESHRGTEVHRDTDVHRAMQDSPL